METKVDIQAGIVKNDYGTFDIKSLGINPATNTEESVKNYLNGIDFSQFTQKSSGVDTFVSTTTSSDAGTKSSTEIKKEIDQLETKKNNNYNNIEKIEKRIKELTNEAKTKIADAVKTQQQDTNAHQKNVERAVANQISKYVDANKNGKGMKKEELSQNIKNALPQVPGLNDVVSLLTDANSFVSTIDSNISELNTLISNTKSIENQIIVKQNEYENALEAESKAQSNVNNEAKSESGNIVTNFFRNIFGNNTGLTLNSSISNHENNVSLFRESSMSLRDKIADEKTNLASVRQQIKASDEGILSRGVSSAQDFKEPEKTENNDKAEDKDKEKVAA